MPVRKAEIPFEIDRGRKIRPATSEADIPAYKSIISVE
jgi:hypothetical protein